MLVNAIDALSGGLSTYFLMRELLRPYFKVDNGMCVFMDKCFFQIISSFFLLTAFNRMAELLISCSKSVMLWLIFLCGST